MSSVRFEPKALAEAMAKATAFAVVRVADPLPLCRSRSAESGSAVEASAA